MWHGDGSTRAAEATAAPFYCATARTKYHRRLEMESRCDKCEPAKCLYQCYDCEKLDKALEASRRESARMEKAAKRVCSEQAKKQELFMSCVRSQFEIKSIPRDGHCLFSAFAAGYGKLKGTELSMREVRAAVADFFVASNGIVTIDEGSAFDVSDECQQPFRGSAKAADAKRKKAKPLKKMSVEEYAGKVRGNLYGGDAEIAAMALKYDVAVQVYSWHIFHENNVFAPQVFNASSATKGTVSLLFEQKFANAMGTEDHYDTILVDKFKKWRGYMCAMPKWGSDVGVCTHDLRGRGVVALKEFKKGDVLMWYDGHRVDPATRKVGFESSFLTALYNRLQFDPEAESFHPSHALRLGRRHCTDFVIDGYPTTNERFDSMEFMGRAALANSASAKESNMKCVWVKSPNFPPDLIEKIADCECFMVARRDIQ